jgi:hypothetical protein
LDVLQYDKDDIEGENVLNGTDENIDYSVYQGPAGIIELVLTLEEPDRFDVYFTQGIPEGTPPNNQTMNFISR